MTDGPDREPHDAAAQAAAVARAALPAPDEGDWETVRPEGAAEDLQRDDVLAGGVQATPAVAAAGGGAAAALAIAGAIRRRRATRRLRDADEA